MIRSARTLGLAALALCLLGGARADDLPTYEIELKNHSFKPSVIHVATGKPFIVVVTNDGDGPDEFEMLIPAVERGLQPGQTGRVKMKALGVGRFPFFGESDPDNETGAFISE